MIGDISHIVVIESLKDSERKTGTELYYDTIQRKIEFLSSSMKSRFFSVLDKNEFIESLNYIEANAQYMESGILIHIEAHGAQSHTGISLQDGSLITWKDLIGTFRAINIITKNNLYISLATCFGRYMFEEVDSDLKSPYSCYISAIEEVLPSEIVDQFSLLFENLIEQCNLVKAYLFMQTNGSAFFYMDSEETFKAAFKISSDRLKYDLDLRTEIIDQARELINKGEMTMSENDLYEIVLIDVLKDYYERQKKTFEFEDNN